VTMEQAIQLVSEAALNVVHFGKLANKDWQPQAMSELLDVVSETLDHIRQHKQKLDEGTQTQEDLECIRECVEDFACAAILAYATSPWVQARIVGPASPTFH
jgi:hypothetical protein